MAAGQNVPELGGYAYEFTGKVSDNYNCLVCHLPMKNPVQIVGCGHRLCNICMESLLRRPLPFCPADRQPLSRDKIFPDAAFHREILDLTVKCSHFGCPWTGELRAVEKHFDVCQKFPVQCPNKCGLREIPREKLEVHIRDECPKTEVNCEYMNLGCEAVFPRPNANSHSKLQVERHLNLALRSLEATQFQVHDLISLVKDQSQQMERLTSQVKEQSQQIERLMAKDKEKSEQIERLKTANNTNDSFVWKISNFQALLDRARRREQVMLSEPFYLSKNGYKLRLKLKLQNIFNLGIFDNEVFLTLFIRVVPGEFDPLLSWPLTEKVRVTVIDQNPRKDERENISEVIDFEKKRDPCPRPLAEKDDFDYDGLFLIEKESLKSRSYIMNNTIFIIASKEK